MYLHLPNGMARTKLTNVYFDSKLKTVSTATELEYGAQAGRDDGLVRTQIAAMMSEQVKGYGMAEATIFEARNYFSQMVKRAAAGETITITSGRAKRPIAKLVPIEEKKKVPRLGFMLMPGFELTRLRFLTLCRKRSCGYVGRRPGAVQSDGTSGYAHPSDLGGVESVSIELSKAAAVIGDQE